MTGNSTCPIDTSLCTFQTCPRDCAQVEYLPSVGANAFFLAGFGLVIVAQAFLGVRYRTWGFLVGMVCGLVLEIIGYIGRLMLHHNPFDFNAFLIYLIPLTIGPAFLTAAIYLTLSRLIITYSPGLARISPKITSITFMCSDLISLILQAAGGAIASTASDSSGSNVGRNIMIAGLAWQVLSLIVFMLIWAEFMWRVSRASEESKTQTPVLRNLRTGNRMFIWFQYSTWAATVLIFIRSVYRVAELQGGFNGTIANNQPGFIVLESVMVLLACVSLTVFHPGLAYKAAWSQASWSLKEDKNFETLEMK